MARAVISLRQQIKRGWQRIRGGELTPSRAFWSVAIGVFIGVQPTPGLHLPAVLFICLALRLDAAVSYLAANISIPPIAPFLWFGAIQIGSRILSGAFIPLTVDGATSVLASPGPLLGALGLGSITLGAGLGLAFGTLAFFITRLRRPDRVDEIGEAFKNAAARTADRFRHITASRGTYYYVRGKLLGDPATRAIARCAPLGDVIDVGAGRGQLALMLLELGAASRVDACDWDNEKIALAQRACEGHKAAFFQADVRSAELPAGDTVLLVDILHYFERDEQDRLLLRAAERVRSGGRLILREASLGYGLRSTLTYLAERIGTAIRFNRGERVQFRDVRSDFVPLLEKNGFRCEVEPCWSGTPFANVLLVAHRSPG